MSEERAGQRTAEAPGLAAARRRLDGRRGPEFWRSLEELAGSPEFTALLESEFPSQAATWAEGVDRRRFLQLSAASLALGGLTACTRQPLERIVPYVQQPEQLVPGRPEFYATSFALDGYALGVLAESHMGRPTKIEGNPEHPASLGATDLFAQASVLTLYDPDRSQVIKNLGRIRNWTAFVEETRAALTALAGLGGARLRILTGTVTSPTLARQIRLLLEELPRARWHQYDPVGRDDARAGAEAAFGRPLETRYDLSAARVVVTLDSDLLTSGPGCVRYARDFAAARRPEDADGSMNRLYAVESSPSSTGTMADHRLALRPGQVGAAARLLASELGVAGASPPAGLPPAAERWLRAAARDLERAGAGGLVVAGDFAPRAVHVLAHAVNRRLGAVGSTVRYTAPVAAEPVDQGASLRRLADDMRAGEVDVLLVLGGNPVYDAPADVEFAAAMQQVPRRIHLGLYEDETAALSHWHIPEAHYLESWGDGRAFDGTATLVQPLIEPLHDGKSPLELLSALSAGGERPAYEIVRETWQGALAGDSEKAWRRVLHDGFVVGSAFPEEAAELLPPAVAEADARLREDEGSGPELVFRPDPTLHDGRFANNAWLQECPKPLTKLTWENAALMSPAMARQLGLDNGRVVVLTAGGRSLRAPVWILPGHPDGSVTLHLGHGRTRAGRVGSGFGRNVNTVRTTESPWRLSGLEIRPTAEREALASTQLHNNIAQETEEAEKRHLVREATLEEYRAHPDFAHHGEHAGAEAALFPPHEYAGYAWGLAVDLSACTGCNACVVACQSENNIPVVGREMVAMGREMHWIRIDRYFQGDLDSPRVHHQPVMCMHCEQAPCEVVCPVAATVHSEEGLNDMVYNRCVGTRYCSNNCPYKVRRFNFLKYTDTETPVLKMLRNPDVTVRTRGVMEKCTYCVQRINYARIDAEREGRKIGDGEVRTACQQVCPSRAIAFGDINDESSEVSRWKHEPRGYGILEELATRPRTTYLARLRNPNPELEEDRHDA